LRKIETKFLHSKKGDFSINMSILNMEEKISFEIALFRDGIPDCIVEIDDVDFVINTLVNLSIFRPLKYDMIFELHKSYSCKKDFREKFLDKALKKNNFFVSLLIDKKIYNPEDIRLHFGISNETEEIIDLSNHIIQIDFPESDICRSTFELTEKIIETSYAPGSIEYCLKYDDIDEILYIYQNPSFFRNKAEIIGIENLVNLDFDLLGFCGFFGSVKCFKFLLETEQFKIDQNVIECVVCGGSIEIFHLCTDSNDISGFIIRLVLLSSFYNNLDLLSYFCENGAYINAKDNEENTPLHLAAAYGHLSVVEYLVNQKADINAKDTKVEFFHLRGLLFIMLLKKVILVLFNI